MGIGPEFIEIMIIVLLSITVHEFAHAKSADLAGDPTPRLYGRVTLNPVKHFDPAGLFMIFFSSLTGFGIGWGKPVPVDARRMHHPRWDDLLVSIWGPFSNILLALLCSVVLRLVHPSEGVFDFLVLAVTINLALAFFNLIPLFPLDGSWVVKDLLPERAGFQFYQWNRSYGVIILLGSILILGPMGYSPFRFILWPVVDGARKFLLGLG